MSIIDQINHRIDYWIQKYKDPPPVADDDSQSVSPVLSDSSWKMEDYSPSREVTEIESVDDNDRVHLLKVVLEEYRHLPVHLPTGMVVVPSFDTLLEWHGCLHLKSGHYKGGIFKFSLHIPVDYPDSPPSVYFFNPIFHPLVDEETGELDLRPAFPTWRPGRDYIVLVLAYLKKIFFKRELYSTALPRREFITKCEECVADSLRLIYVPHPNSPIIFEPWRKGNTLISLIDASEHRQVSPFEAIQEKIEDLEGLGIPIQQQVDQLVDFVLHDIVQPIPDPVEDGVVIHN
jgi:ubiquitin-protein ligase